MLDYIANVGNPPRTEYPRRYSCCLQNNNNNSNKDRTCFMEDFKDNRDPIALQARSTMTALSSELVPSQTASGVRALLEGINNF